MKRTLENLRNTINGQLYIYCDNEKIGKQFLQDAENEGYRFGKMKPTDNGWINIVALEKKKQLSFVGFCGHMNFQCNGGSNGGLTRVDYEKYVNGEKNFIFKNKPLNQVVVKSNVYGDITVLGNDCFDASVELKKLLDKYGENGIDAICDEIENNFDVIVVPEEED